MSVLNRVPRVKIPCQFPISHNMLIYAKMLEMAGELQDALYYYEQCINAEGDPEEQWHARIRRAFMLWRLERPVLEVCQAFMDAVDARPHRAEGWRDLAGFLEAHGNHIAAATARKHYSELPIPDDVMYVEPCLYGGVA